MKLARSEIVSFEEQWLKDHPEKNDNPKEYISFLNGLNEIILNHEYEVDERFVTYSRRDFLRQEFSDYLNEKIYSGRGKFNDAFVDLAEYYSGNTWISISSVPSNVDFHEIENADCEYKKDGIICKQEIEIIKEMIQEFKDHLNKLNEENEQLNSVNKDIYPQQDRSWINYLTIDEITHERKLSEKTPEDIKNEYNRYLEIKIDQAVKLLEDKFMKTPLDTEVTVLRLLETLPDKYDEVELTNITTKFFEKCGDYIEFTNSSDERIGFIYNLAFKKK